jgi:hypothetical protein
MQSNETEAIKREIAKMSVVVKQTLAVAMGEVKERRREESMVDPGRCWSNALVLFW